MIYLSIYISIQYLYKYNYKCEPHAPIHSFSIYTFTHLFITASLSWQVLESWNSVCRARFDRTLSTSYSPSLLSTWQIFVPQTVSESGNYVLFKSKRLPMSACFHVKWKDYYRFWNVITPVLPTPSFLGKFFCGIGPRFLLRYGYM